MTGHVAYEPPRITTLDEAAVASAVGPVRLSTAVEYSFETAGSARRTANESGPNRR
jgi:hypothetical protein